jgi:hypothetical protein
MLIEAPIDYSSVVTTTMMFVRLLDKGFALPYGALITRIAEHAGVDMTGLREIQPQKGAMGVRFLNASQAHLREEEQEPRAQGLRRLARVGRALAGVEERLDHLEDTVRQTQKDLQQALQALQRARVDDHAILDRLCKHLMGPLDVKDYGIPSSSFSRGRGSPGARGNPSARGSLGKRGSPGARGTPTRESAEPTLRRRPCP